MEAVLVESVCPSTLFSDFTIISALLDLADTEEPITVSFAAIKENEELDGKITPSPQTWSASAL